MKTRLGSTFLITFAIVAGGAAIAQPPQNQDSIPDTPGTGPFTPHKEIDSGLPDQVVYRPADLSTLGDMKLGVYVFGNGGCSNDGASARLHLLNVASHGYLAIAPGGIYNGPGKTEAPPRPADTSIETYAATRPAQLTAAIDWALTENRREGSRYYGRIDPEAIALSGFSCGGIQALTIAADPRVATVIVMNSGLFIEGETRMGGMVETKGRLTDLHTPTLYVLGGPTDIAYANGMDDYAKIDHVPVAVASIDKGHGGTYWEPNGGAAADVVVQWLAWQLRSDAEAARMFVGADCGLCTDPAWAYESKRLNVSVVDGTFDDGTRWALAKPANWNGTVILDLDGANFMSRRGRSAEAAPSPVVSATIESYFSGFNAWLLENGYAYGGITREPVGYDFPLAVELMLEARAQAAEAWGTPERTLVLGSSRGAFAGRKALELRPDIFDGGLISAGGGAGEIAVLNNKLNAVFVLKTLVDPQAPLALVNIDPQAETQALSALVTKAGSTPAGRARLALASAIVQMPLWTNARSPKPDADDFEAQLDQMQASWSFAIATPVRAAVEAMAGGNVSWNTGVDYSDLLAKSGRDDMVRALYAAAGLRLGDDLQTLAAAPRISADPQAVARAERLMTYSGRISDPLVNVDNDDPVDPLSDKLAYRELLRSTGSDNLFQLLWSDRPGHGGMSALDRAVGFSLLVDYLENGEWGDVSLPALRRRAQRIRAATRIDLGELYLYEPSAVPPAASTWDARSWGSYKAD